MCFCITGGMFSGPPEPYQVEYLALAGGGGGSGAMYSQSGFYAFAICYASKGGSGSVFIRYPGCVDDAITTGSPCFCCTGGYKYYYFQGSGSITMP